MEYNKIPVVLKRYSFEGKMQICTEYSSKLVDINGLINVENFMGNPHPWELETFALFSVLSINEYDNKKFNTTISRRQFTAIINSFRAYMPTVLESSKNDMKFIEYYMIVAGLTQFQIQEPFIYKYHRYNYFFNFKNEKVNMSVEFFNKYGTDYKDFVEFGWLINAFYSKNYKHNDDNKKIVDFLFKKYRHVLIKLVIERENLILLQHEVSSNIDDYVYCFKYFYQFPFVMYEEKFYLPLPHLLFQSVTSSLLFRLTEGNNGLRNSFGKEVLESYLFDITNSSFNYEEIKQELDYKGPKGDDRSLDLMIKHKNQCLLIDVKSMSPKISIRNLEIEAIDFTQNRLIKQLVNLYNHIKTKFMQEYFPFNKNSEFTKENIFGFVVILEDSYIRREIIHQKAAAILEIHTESDDYKWMCANLRIVSLSDYERLIFHDENIFDHLTFSRDTESTWFNFTIYQDEVSANNDMNSSLYESQNVLIDMFQNLEDELREATVLGKF